MKAKKTWILVADGARARILLNEGPGKGLAPALGYDFAVSHAPTHEIGAERPGRSHESSGDGSRHAMENRVDWHQFEKQKFARDVAKELNKAAYEGAFDRLVLVLPPKSLGEVRGALDKHARERVVGELAKDLTHLPTQDLEGHLEDTIAL